MIVITVTAWLSSCCPERAPEITFVVLIVLAQACSVMGMKTETFELLEVAYQERASWLVPLALYRSFRNIRTDPRFADLLRRMGLPEGPLPKAL